MRLLILLSAPNTNILNSISNIFKDKGYFVKYLFITDIEINKVPLVEKLLNQHQNLIESRLFKANFEEITLDENSSKIEESFDYVINLTSLTTLEIQEKLGFQPKNIVEIWYNGSNLFKNQSLLGVKEPIDKKDCIEIDIIERKNNQNLLLYTAKFNWFWSSFRNQKDIYLQLGTVLYKALQDNHSKKINLPIEEKNAHIGLSTFLLYLFNFYKNIFRSIWNKLLFKFFKIKHNCWSLSWNSGTFNEDSKKNAKNFKMPYNEFWADPFLVKKEDKTYLFFENYDYYTQLGKISCGEILNGELINIQDVLIRPYHLSYPFILEENGEYYMIPESSAGKKVEVLKSTKFPYEWHTHKILFEGEEIVDTTFHKDNDGQYWIFLNKGGIDLSSQLHIYQIDFPNCDKIISHHQNPIYINSEIARNAGSIFKQNGNLIRPSQNNSNGTYGYKLNLNIIQKLTIDEFEEELMESFSPNINNKTQGIHHLCQIDGQFVYDISYKNRKN